MRSVLTIFLGFIGIFLVANVVFLDYMFVNQKESVVGLQTRIGQMAFSLKEYSNQNNVPVSVVASGSGNLVQTPLSTACPQSCISLINNVKNTTAKPVSPVPSKPGVTTSKAEYVVPMGSGVVNTIGSWVDSYSAQATVDTSAYSKIKAIYFEVVMHLPNATGEMRAKLIDDSTPFSYDGQVVTTTSGTGQLLSVQVPLVSGKKTYHVQLYSTISPGVMDIARIRIVTQ